MRPDTLGATACTGLHRQIGDCPRSQTFRIYPRLLPLLETALPGRIIVQRFSWRWYAQTARRCKLYDVASARWMDFSGRVSEPTTWGRVAS